MPDTLDICIIEDDEDARASLIDLLELDRHRVKAFSTAHAALACDELADVDVILVDRKLPDGLAEKLVPTLRQIASQAEVIIITGYADLHAAIAALREGVSDYLIKPIDHDALRTTLYRLAKRRLVENELHRQRRFAEKLLETAEAVILVLDVKGQVQRANPYLLELTDHSLEEVIGCDWFDTFVPHRERERVRSVFMETVNNAITRGVTNSVLCKDGRECVVRWSNATLRDSEGKTTAVLSVGLDMTDFVNSQKKSLQNERLAAIGQTITGMAHESRNALQRIQNALCLLQDELHDQPDALRDLAKIERASNHIRDLLEEVRSYAAPINLNRREQSVLKIWRRAWSSVSHLTTPRDVTLREPSLIFDEESYRGMIDARRMEQVFRNLFENSLEATTGSLIISIDCVVEGSMLRITVGDDGPGVPVTHQDTIFEAFATTKPTGTGLGLAICRRAVEAHGGTMILNNSRKGAQFIISLPAAATPSEVD